MFNVRWVEAKVAIECSVTGVAGWNGARLCLCAWAAVVTFINTTALCVGERHGLRNGTAWVSAAE